MEIDGIGSEQAQLAYLGAAGGVAVRLDAGEAVATTDVGRGGGGVLGVAGRVAWAQGERNRRRTQGRRWHWYIYICHAPLLPVPSPHRE